MLPLKINCPRGDLAQLAADAVQAAPKNSVTQASWQAQKSQNLGGGGGTRILRGSQTRALRAKIKPPPPQPLQKVNSGSHSLCLSKKTSFLVLLKVSSFLTKSMSDWEA